MGKTRAWKFLVCYFSDITSFFPFWMKASSTVIQSTSYHFIPDNLRANNMFLVYISPDQKYCTKEPHTHVDLRQMMRFELWAAAIVEWDFWKRSACISNVGDMKGFIRGYSVVDHFQKWPKANSLFLVHICSTFLLVRCISLSLELEWLFNLLGSIEYSWNDALGPPSQGLRRSCIFSFQPLIQPSCKES